jgi:hypothetical protein
MGGLSKLDITCLIGAFIGVLAWQITGNPAIALYCSIAAEFLGYIPLFRKAYTQPETESTLSWIIGLTAACLNLFAITSLQLHIALYPIYVVASDGLVVVLLLISRRRFQAKDIQTKNI